ncbi:MAG TPA: pantoate--beta-alanine ligase, partial [Crocinitomicaceae bacterium]|nr:pantoate--beta-alanine ligase [Crocinitomicaceae bacterium]
MNCLLIKRIQKYTKKSETSTKTHSFVALKIVKMIDSKVFTSVDSLRNEILSRGKGKKVGFVPTMGALHHGHMSLVRKAYEYAEIVVVSIFVNPMQFNNSKDLEKYPRTLKADIDLLSNEGDVIVFAPSVEEMYPPNYKEIELDLGDLATVMEGKFRNGHFNGVVNVVNRLFEIVQPNFSFFGLKDFQQLSIIQFMTKELQLPIEIVGCEIVREESGLASSSRNARLSEKEKADAVILSTSLRVAKELSTVFPPIKVKEIINEIIARSSLELEY